MAVTASCVQSSRACSSFQSIGTRGCVNKDNQKCFSRIRSIDDKNNNNEEKKKKTTTKTMNVSNVSKTTRAKEVKTEREIKQMSLLQAKCFYTQIISKTSIVDQLSMFLFKQDVRDTLLEKLEFVRENRFRPLCVKESLGDEIVAVAEVSVQRDVLVGRAVKKFKNLSEMDSEYCYVSCMCVADEYRKMGLATELMRECECVAKAWGYRLLLLHCYEDNEAAYLLYKRLGYEEVLNDLSFKTPLDLILRKRKVLMAKDI